MFKIFSSITALAPQIEVIARAVKAAITEYKRLCGDKPLKHITHDDLKNNVVGNS